MTSNDSATPKQLSYLLALINRLEGSSASFLSQTKWGKANLRMRERSGQISKARASALIDQVKSELGE
jgi:hypothetical protein